MTKMFKSIDQILLENFPLAEVKTYVFPDEWVNEGNKFKSSYNQCVMYEFKSEKISLQISTVNEEYPMGSLTFINFTPNNANEKEKEMKEFIDKYIQLLEDNDHHCLVDVYDGTKDPILNIPNFYRLVKGIYPCISKRIVGDAKKNYIERKIKELKKYA